MFLVLYKASACTVFVLADEDSAFYFGNENTSLTGAQIWFLPGGENARAGAYIGFDGAAETGVNTAGLAFDWVNKYNDVWDRMPDAKTVRGNYGQRMLEQCATLDAAIDFCRKYPHPVFANARLMIADKTGASAIVGVRNGGLSVDRFADGHGLGTGIDGALLEDMPDVIPVANIDKGFELLDRCFEGGRTPTRYSNFFNLKTGELKIKHVNQTQAVDLYLEEELALGPHYYVVKDLRAGAERKPLPLEISMHRFPTDAYEPLRVQDQTLIGIVSRTIKDLASGRTPQTCSVEFRKELSPDAESISSELNALGSLETVSMLRSDAAEEGRNLLCRLEFTDYLLLQEFRLDENGMVTGIRTIAAENKGRED